MALQRRYWCVNAIFASILYVVCTGCSTCCAHKSCGSTVTRFDDYTNYFCSWYSKTKMTVYETDGRSHIDGSAVDTNRPAILILHELPGMTPQCLSLATNIAHQGYTVYLPLMFDRPDEDCFLSSAWNTVFLLLSPNWFLFHKYETPRVTGKLKVILSEVEQKQNLKKMGVLGMCLSGALPLALLSNTNVQTVVLSQPALPFGFTKRQKSALGLSFADVSFAVNRVSNEQISILGFRFCTDTICTADRIDSLHQLFGRNFHDHTIPVCECRTNKCANLHSVLCEQYDNAPGSPTRNCFDAMIADFDKQLKP